MANAVATSYKPTKKWIAAAVSGVLLIVVHAIASGGFDTTEWGEVGALVTALAASYVQSNDATPGGVPLK
jgi:hypothetical protein